MSRQTLVGTLVRPISRGKHHVLAYGFSPSGRWEGTTLCGRYVDRSTWEGQDAVAWASEDGCARCGYRLSDDVPTPKISPLSDDASSQTPDTQSPRP